MKYLTKAELYKSVDNLMEELDIKAGDYPLDAIFLAKKFLVDTQIIYDNFDNLCALLYRGKKSTTIALNSRRSRSMQNFDCMHEIIHYFLHEDVNSFQCIGSENAPNLNDSLEWQANEGAAEALLPYRLFIPMYISFCAENEDTATSRLAKYFGVTTRVAENRIDNLKYEIYQYKVLNKSIDEIEILSKSSCERRNLTNLTAKIKYCSVCHSAIEENAHFCSICGSSLDGENKTELGVSYVCYDKIELLSDNRTRVCPVCENTELSRTGFYCHLCGAPIVNRCTNSSGKDINGLELEWPCNSILSGDARFCPDCGSKSLFYKEGLLKKL